MAGDEQGVAVTVAVETAAGRAGGLSAGQASLWRATDALLYRPVAIHLLAGGVRVPAHVMAAVQAAARVNDPRLATFYDTDYDLEGPYIVSEWTPGTHLEDL